KEVLSLLNLLERLERDKRMNLINYDEAGIRSSRITNALLELFSKIKEENGKNSTTKLVEEVKAPSVTSNNRENKGKTSTNEVLSIYLFLADSMQEAQIPFLEEFNEITRSLASRNENRKFSVFQGEHSTFNDFGKMLKNQKPDVIHFVGHGQGYGGKGLIFAKRRDRREAEVIKATNLAASIADYREKFCPNLRLIVLNACFTADVAKEISKYGIYAVGISDEIISSDATNFAAGFYEEYERTLSPKEAAYCGRAIIKGRNDRADELIHLYYEGKRIFF
ncbi:MAG: CHAT domain-containing protein, partial [Bacteroidota bacterium]